MSNEPIEGEVLNQMPATAVQSTALAVNPYERMALVAIETGRGMEQLERFMDMQLKWDAAQAAKQFTAAMASFKAEPIKIIKSKAVGYTTTGGDFVGYKHATMADVADAVVPAMGKHGLSHRWDVKQENNQITVACIITHRDGHSESCSMTAAPDKSGKKNAIQEVASTITYLQRYTLMALCGVAASDQQEDDGKSFSADEIEYVTEEQLCTLDVLCDGYVRNKGSFLKWVSGEVGHEVLSLGEIPAKFFDLVQGELKSIKAKREASNAS